MKRVMILVLLALLLAGCSGAEDPYRVDTVVYIPADPSDAPTEEPVREETAPEAPTEPETEAPEQTTAATEAPETEPEPTEEPKKDTPTKKPSSGKKGTTGKKDNSDKETEPPETEPAEPKPTEPKPAEPKPTEPKPVETEPAATEPPVEKPKETEPPATEAPAEEPKATEPPAAETEPEKPELYDISGYSVGSLEKSMKKAINSYRTEADLDELSLSSRLSAIASCRSYEISQVWSHTRPDGRSYKTVLSDYGYGAGSVQELLVYVSGSGDGAAIIEKWMNSDSHKELLLGGYSTVGIGIYRAGGYTYITCLLVG